MSLTILKWLSRSALFMVAIALFSSTLTAAWTDIRWEMYKHADKVAHFLAMFALTLLSYLSFPHAKKIVVLVALIALAAGIEFAQLFSVRSADFEDFAWSCIGTAVYALIHASTEASIQCKAHEECHQSTS